VSVHVATPADAAPVRAVPTRAPRRPAADYGVFGLLVAFSLGAGLLIASLVVAVTGASPADVVEAMVRGSVGSVRSWVTTVNHTSIILVIAIGAAVAGRAGLLNIGQEGQVVIGATLGVTVALHLSGPAWIVLPATLAAAAVGGGLWAGVAALLKYTRGVNEVVSTLLLNFLAIQLVSFLVNRPNLLQEDTRAGSATAGVAQSNAIDGRLRLPDLASGTGYRLHLGIVVAVALALVAGFVLTRTTWGFTLRAFGLNPRATRRTGARTAVVGATALVISGAAAGLAGGILLTGVSNRVNPNLANNFGWEGLLVALVAGYTPLAAIPVALLFGALRAGGGVVSSTGISPTIVGVVQALTVLAVLLPSIVLRRREEARQARIARDRT
jgi:simple sugar transport system permease protein